jgi:hypothetical protein
MFSYNPFERALINLEGKNRDSGNTLFIRDEGFTSERLKNSLWVSVLGREF